MTARGIVRQGVQGVYTVAPLGVGMERTYARTQAKALGQDIEDVLVHRAAGEHWCKKGKHWLHKKEFDVMSNLEPCANCREHNLRTRFKRWSPL